MFRYLKVVILLPKYILKFAVYLFGLTFKSLAYIVECVVEGICFIITKLRSRRTE